LKDSLAGKIHITTGGLDTFYLEGAVEQLIGTLKELGSDAQVEVVPGKNHGNVITPALRSRERRQMTAAFARHHPEHREAAVSP
jgi:dienelactone hydrolase